MARYIDADKVHEGVEALQISLESNNDAIWEKNKPYYKGLAMARAVINETPTADVAPRAEVEKLYEVIFKKEDLMQKIAEERNKYADELEAAKDTNEHLKAEVAREIFEEIEKFRNRTPFGYICFSIDEFEEIKKKYTEGQK